MILASVILCCATDDENIGAAIEAFNDQDWPHRELIVVSPVKLSVKNSIISPPDRDSMIHAGVAKAKGEYCIVWTPGYRYHADAIRVQLNASDYGHVVSMCQATEHISFSFARRCASMLNSASLGRRYIESGHSGFVERVWVPPGIKEPDLTGYGKEGALNIMCPAGIGDVLWILGKFSKLAKERDIVFWLPSGEQHRAGGLCRMAGVNYSYLPSLTTHWVWEQPGSPELPDAGWVVVQANRHLENGRHILDWYPEIPLSYPEIRLNYQSKSQKYVLGFMCLATYMGGQLPPKVWGEIFRYVEQHVAPVVLVGAGSDVPFAQEVEKHYRSPLAPLYNQPLEEVVAAVLASEAVLGVASGLLITSIVYGRPSLVSYPKHLRLMPGTWEPEKSKWTWCFHENLPETVFSGAVQQLLK